MFLYANETSVIKGDFFVGSLCHIIQCSTERFQSLKWYAYLIQSSTWNEDACQSSDPLAFALPSKVMWWVSCVSCFGETRSQEREQLDQCNSAGILCKTLLESMDSVFAINI
jgi:hypothetical protein